MRGKAVSANADGFMSSHLVVPQFLAFKLLKKISQGNVACEPRGFITAETPSFEQQTHRVTPAKTLHRHEGGWVKSRFALT